MGVEYRHFVIPKHATALPKPEIIANLANELARGRWIAAPKSGGWAEMTFRSMKPHKHAQKSGVYARTPSGYLPAPFPLDSSWIAERLGQDLLLCWPVERLGPAQLRYPLNPRPDLPDFPAEDIYYEFELHLCQDYVYRNTSEVISPFKSTRCACGTELEFGLDGEDIFYSSRLHFTCPKCKTPFDPSRLSVTVRDAWTGAESKSKGGATSRFAIVIDCGKCISRDEWRPCIESELLKLCERVLGLTLREIGDFY